MQVFKDIKDRKKVYKKKKETQMFETQVHRTRVCAACELLVTLASGFSK